MPEEVEAELLLAHGRCGRRQHLTRFPALAVAAQAVDRVIGPLGGRVGKEGLV
jgi:hypothetical protein